MAIKILKNNKEKGYAILFAIIIVSAISVVTAGLITASYKQLILSSLANDSQIAFYQADKGAECALYLDRYLDYFDGDPSPPLNQEWVCGQTILNIEGKEEKFKIVPKSLGIDPCFKIDINLGGETTKITSKGYNVCNLSNKRALERSIQIEYKDE
jgi:hypothetical protein